MPKKPPRNNPKGRELRTVHSAGAGAAALLQRITRRAGVQLAASGGAPPAPAAGMAQALRALLPADLQGHVLDVLAKDEEMVLFADSAVWAARLRLWLAEHVPALEGRRTVVRLRHAQRSTERSG